MATPAPNYTKPYWEEGSSDAFYSSLMKKSESSNPIVYEERYNFGLWGFERFHPFDAQKFSRIITGMKKGGMLKMAPISPSRPAGNEHLGFIHTQDYLESLQDPAVMARVAEFPLLALLPRAIAKRKFLEVNQWHVMGTIIAGKLALEHTWAINVGGGMHHAHSSGGGGWCVYSDIVLSFQHLRVAYPERVKKVMVIDLDVHQGNGVERDVLMMDSFRESTYVLDAYRGDLYPNDSVAAAAISLRVRVSGADTDEMYLTKIQGALDKAFRDFQPDICYYNAGTDILVGDPLGGMQLSPECVVKRDEMVWEKCTSHQVPIVYLTSGGYTKPLSAETVTASLLNLNKKFGLVN
ncbi:unnamed protein product [Chrysoparadoxa australica]